MQNNNSFCKQGIGDVVTHFWVPTQKIRKYKKKYSEEIKNNRSKKRMLECRKKVKICLGGSKMQKVKI
jgi:hypothetical protein